MQMTSQITCIQFFSYICFFMGLKSIVMSKCFTTLITFIGLLSSMCSFMHLKITEL
ncbi:hypothetical protein LEMLEM_LOCUS16855 [Lemmus lemmus]